MSVASSQKFFDTPTTFSANNFLGFLSFPGKTSARTTPITITINNTATTAKMANIMPITAPVFFFFFLGGTAPPIAGLYPGGT